MADFLPPMRASMGHPCIFVPLLRAYMATDRALARRVKRWRDNPVKRARLLRGHIHVVARMGDGVAEQLTHLEIISAIMEAARLNHWLPAQPSIT